MSKTFPLLSMTPNAITKLPSIDSVAPELVAEVNHLSELMDLNIVTDSFTFL
mgnify:CR=1 FL=1